jgi:hypothetical protein
MQVLTLHEQIESLVKEISPVHPFEKGLKRENAEPVLSHYLGLCLCAPYIIGGSNKDLFLNCIFSGRKIDKNIEITTAISSFLSLDETGSYMKLMEGGHEALPDILDTSNFHSNILRRDLKFLFGKNIEPVHTSQLKYYFVQLSEGLSSLDDLQRCACLVALEVHSEIMILALWNSIHKAFPEVDKDKLEYFYLHVGGNNPAEQYHVEMTERMIDEIVSTEDFPIFAEYLKKFYTLNVELCNHILNQA